LVALRPTRRETIVSRPGEGLPSRSEGRPLRLGLAFILALTLWRVLLLPFHRADLFVDDAQYWLWSQELAWGYFSKPPLLAWILRVVTDLGSDAPFWIRLPLPLIHAATAVLLMALGRRLFDARVGALAGMAWVSLPAVSVGSVLLSTDTPMLFFLALAMLVHLRLIERASLADALVLGAAIGLGLLSKYAMGYFVLSALLAALVLPQARLRTQDGAAAAIVALAIVAPHLWWNATHRFVTIRHTISNADWGDASFQPLHLSGFLASQFAVAGPVIFGAYLASLRRSEGRDVRFVYLALMSLPVLAIISAQALVVDANANWAAAGLVGVTLAASARLTQHPRWLTAGLAINVAVALAVPVTLAFADRLALPSGTLVFQRYIGRAEVSRHAAAVAQAENLDIIVSNRRDMLADLFHTLRNEDLAIYSEPRPGPPAHYYAQMHILPPGPGEVLHLTLQGQAPVCRPGAPAPHTVAQWRPERGYYAGREVVARRVSQACWDEG
jgi:4-amino-4-deoxy-L-arabinose transferase-like glycosyltransferase